MHNTDRRDGGAPWPRLDTGIAIPVEPARLPPTPELRLCLAILEQALADLAMVRRRTVSRRDGRATAVVAWFRSGSVEWPFAFETICATLGLDAQAVRRAVGVMAA
jgi:hypothetical protein